jgi:hypothetical protein
MCSTPSSRNGQVVARSADAGGIAGDVPAVGIVGSTRRDKLYECQVDAQRVDIPTQVLDKTCGGGR